MTQSLNLPYSVSAPSAANGRGSIESLQLLRFLAAFAVVLFHVGSGLEVGGLITTNPAFYGSGGVDVFFVLSGFIITYATDPSASAGDFLKRRVARIVPIYWLLTSLLILVAWIRPGLLRSVELDLVSIVKSYLFIPYLKPNGEVQPMLFLGWTLCYEVAFYAIFCLSIPLGRYANLATAAVIVALVSVGRSFQSDSVLFGFYTNPIVLEFLLGMLLFHFYERWSFMRAAPLPVALTTLAIGLLLFTAGSETDRVVGRGIPAVLIVAAFLMLKLPASRTMALFVLLGNASYSLYLLHPYLVQACIKPLHAGSSLGLLIAASVAGTVLSLLASVALFKFFERPSQRLLQKAFGIGGGRGARGKA